MDIDDKQLSGIALLIIGAITALISSQIVGETPLFGWVGIFMGIGISVWGLFRFS